MKKILLIISIVVFSTLSATEAKACMCGETSIKEAFNQVNSIFVGHVVSGKGGKWSIEVSKVWKGKIEKTVQLIDSSQDENSMTTCSAEFTNGKEYIFFVKADKKVRTSQFYFVSCLFDVEWNDWNNILKEYDKEKFWKKVKAKEPIIR